jgi:tetratricopeptide (TPR) repeat protein
MDHDIRRPVAMKVILGDEDHESLERFVTEAQVTGQLEHPNIVPIHELGLNNEGKVYFTMKLVRGESLDAIIERLAERDPETVQTCPLFDLLTVYLKVCEAIAFAHSKGVIHRDLKPENVMVGKFGEVLVMDWGLAKMSGGEDAPLEGRRKVRSGAEGDTSRTLEGDVIGTLSYMPPEQADGRISEVDERSDIFALGGILYKILTHESPHAGVTMEEVMVKAADGVVVPPRIRSPGNPIPPELESICLKALSPHRRKRYGSVEALMEDIRNFLQHRLVSAHRYGPVARFIRFIQRHPAASLAGGIGILLTLLGVGIVLTLTSWAREQRALAAAESLRAEKAERRAADAEDALVKGRAVSAVLRGADRELGTVFQRLKSSYYSPKSEEEKRAEGDREWPAVKAFERNVPPDSASQAAWLAAKGWLRRLAGYETEANALFEKAHATDPDVAYGLLFKGMDRLVKVLKDSPMPRITSSRRGFRFGAIPPETKALRALREEIEGIMVEVRKARVLGEYSAEDIQIVLKGIHGLQRNDLAGAERGLSKALHVPEMAWLREEFLLTRAKVRYLGKKFHEGRIDVDRVLDSLPDHTRAHYFKGLLLVGQGFVESGHRMDPRGTFARAAESFTEAIQRSPPGSASHIDRANTYNALGDAHGARGEDPRPYFEKAIRDFTAFQPKDKASENGKLGLGSTRKRMGDAMGERGEDPRAMYRQCLIDLSEVLARTPSDWIALNIRGTGFWALGNEEVRRGRDPIPVYRKAIADFTKALTITPDCVEASMNRGNAYTSLGLALQMKGGDSLLSFRNAVADLTEAIRLAPEDAAAHNNRAIAHKRLADELRNQGKDPRDFYRKAVEDATAGLARNPKNVKGHLNRGNAYTGIAFATASRGEDPRPAYRRAIEDFVAVVRINPGNAQGYGNLGAAYLKLGQSEEGQGEDPLASYREGIRACRNSIRLNPRPPQTYFVLGVLYAAVGNVERKSGRPWRRDFEKADDAYAEALDINPNFVEVLINRGGVLEALERFREALTHLEKADTLLKGRHAGLRRAIERIRAKMEEEGR